MAIGSLGLRKCVARQGCIGQVRGFHVWDPPVCPGAHAPAVSRCLSAWHACGQEHRSVAHGEKQRLDTFRELGRGFPDSLWSVSFLEAGAGSWVCAADVLEHEKEPQ